MLVLLTKITVSMLPRLCTALYLTTGLRTNYIRSFRPIILFRSMTTPSTKDDGFPQVPSFTTNDDDRDEVAKLQARLKNTTTDASLATKPANVRQQPLLPVHIAEGVHKYVLIKAEWDGDVQYFVTSRKGAAYHRNAAEPMIEKLEQAGYTNIDVTGGGRLSLDSNTKEIYIYGFSYGFGLADHAISQRTILKDSRYTTYDVTFSNEGY
jgi:phosphohistidine phosphatase